MQIEEIIDGKDSNKDNNVIIWKHSCEDFNTTTQLIVHESQKAIFFLNGEALDMFGPGRHTLETQNIPLLTKKLFGKITGKTPFRSELYFINMAEHMSIEWGVGNINFVDEQNNDYVFNIGASGEMSFKVSDPRKLLVKVLGVESELNKDNIRRIFMAPIRTYVTSILPNVLRNNHISIFDVDTKLDEISSIMLKRIDAEMEDYGVHLVKFWINNVRKPVEDPFYQTVIRQRGERITIWAQGELDLKAAELEKQKQLIGYSGDIEKQRLDIEMKKYEQDKLGYTYQQKESFEVMKKIAENEGSGSDLRNAAMGIGMGFGMGDIFGRSIKNISNDTLTQMNTTASVDVNTSMAAKTSAETDTSAGVVASDSILSDFETKIKKVIMLRDNGLITEEEFNQKKADLLSEL